MAGGTPTARTPAVRTPEVEAPHETDFRIELTADHHVLGDHTVTVAVVGEVAAIAGVVLLQAGRVGLREVAGDGQRVEEIERRRACRSVGGLRAVSGLLFPHREEQAARPT